MSNNSVISIRNIDIGNEFSKALGVTYKKDGDCSGEEFLETILEPAFLKHDAIIIHLDSLTGWSPGFMNGSFCQLVRKHGYEKVNKKIRFETKKREYLVRLLDEWMREAEQDRAP